MSKSRQNLGLFSGAKAFLNEPMPEGVGWTHVFGSVLLFLVGLQIVTGILLALTYSPSTDAAYESIRYIDIHMLFGKWIRGVHHWSASAFVIVLVLHILQTFLYGAYKSPRRSTWVAGVFLLLLVLAFAFTGYLLPWDMKAYFATQVGIEVGASAPVIGPMIARLLKGGNELGSLTLTRFYAAHVVVLPLILLIVVTIHLYYVRIHKITPPWRRNSERIGFTNTFFPKQLARDQIAVTLVFVIIAILASKIGAPLEAKADPTSTTYVPRPDWYFYGLYQLLRIFQGPLEAFATIVLPAIFFLGLFALPLIDKNPERVLHKRKFAVSSGVGVFAVICVLTVWGGLEGAREVALARAKEKGISNVNPSDAKPADPKLGSQLFEQLRCGACHKGPSRGVNIPPGLEYSGSKFRPNWLETYLLHPFRIRWADTNVRAVVRMPDFSLTGEEARNITAFLMQNVNRSLIRETHIDWSAIDFPAISKGRQLFTQYACSGCHRIADEGTNLGPELSHVGSKLQPDYIYRLILKPKEVIPGTPMKDNQLWEDEAEAIVRYLLTLR